MIRFREKIPCRRPSAAPAGSFACGRVAALASLWSLAAGAQTLPVLPTERDFIGELPVVLSVSRLAQAVRDTPASVTVIDREMIRSSGARELADLFRLVPGFSVGRPPSAGSVVTYHGLTETFPRRMQVLVDGRSLYSPFYVGGVEWNLIPVALDDIERIEVVRGSNAAAYGAHAFLGVANIITRSGRGMSAATVELRSGQGGIGDTLVRLAGGNERLAWRVSAAANRDDGIDRTRDDRQLRRFDARFDYRPTARDQLSLRLGQTEAVLQVGSGSGGNPLRLERKEQQFLQVDWQRTLDARADFSLRYVHAVDRARDGFTTTAGPFTVPVDFGAEATRDDIEFQYTLTPSDVMRMVWGAGLRVDSIRAPGFFYGQSQVGNRAARLFANLEWRPFDSLTVNAGATHERDTLVGDTTAPRLAANLHLPGRAGTLRFGVTRAYRAPSLLEARANQAFVATTGVVVQRNLISRPDLRPERLLSREIGYLNERPEIGLSLDIRAFDEHLGDRIDTLASVFAAPYCATIGAALPAPYCGTGNKIVNALDGRIHGLEYRLDWRPRAPTRLSLNQSFVSVSATTLLTPETFPGLIFPTPANLLLTQQTAIANALATQRESAPSRSTMLAWSERLPGGAELSLIHWWQGAMKWTSNTRARAYRRLDWRLAMPFGAGPTHGELAFAVQGDGADRSEYSQNASLGKRGVVSLRLEY